MNHLLNSRVQDVIGQNDKDHQKHVVGGLNLRGQPRKAHEIEIHLLRLKHPRGSRLIDQGPEHDEERN